MKKRSITILYNSPVILTFALLSLLALGLGKLTDGWTTQNLFCVYRSSLANWLTYPRFFLHVLGHPDFAAYCSNIVMLLVVGPMAEERFGGKRAQDGIVADEVIVRRTFAPRDTLGEHGVHVMCPGKINGGVERLGVDDAIGALGDEMVRPPRVGRGNGTGYGGDIAIGAQCRICRREGPARKACLDDEHELGKPRDDAVSPHEGRAQRLGTPRIFGDDSTLGIYDTLEQFTAAFGIGHVSTRAKDDDRRAAAIERRAMRALVTSHRATGDDGNAARGDVRGEHLGAGKTIGRRLAGPDDGDARLQCRRIADAAKHTRRIGRIAQYGRIFDRSDVDLEARAV